MKKTFRWLNWTQFTGAFNDNAFKTIAIVYLVQVLGHPISEVLALCSILFVIPFLLLSNVAGDRSINLVLSMLIPGPDDDGKVAVGRSKPAAYTDYCCLHATHACMVWNTTVIEQIKHFLKHEAFFVDEGNLSQAPEWLRASFVLDKQDTLHSSLHAPEKQPDSPGLTKQDASSTKFEIRNTKYAIRNTKYAIRNKEDSS